MVTRADIQVALDKLAVEPRPVCLHVSLQSFGEIDGGGQTLVDAFLERGCTVMLPTFSDLFAVPPPLRDRPPRNGIDYEAAKFMTSRPTGSYDAAGAIYTREEMGELPGVVLAMPGRMRGNHGLRSFAAVGPLAHDLIDKQSPRNVYAPLKALVAADGLVFMMGVDLTKMTLIHLAEQRAGRTPFVRWASGPGGPVVRSQVGSCSRGYTHFEPFLGPLAAKVSVGTSAWRVFSARSSLQTAVSVLRLSPRITHCGDPTCLRCSDAVGGGPVLE